MAGEPELRSGSGGEWVLYLQQTLNHHYQQQVTEETGDYDTALESVVQHFQRQQGLEPTGVVDVATWGVLTGEAAPPTYVWPDEPIAAATVDVDGGVVELRLTLTGEAPAGVPTVTVDLPATLTSAEVSFGQPEQRPVDDTCVELVGACHLLGAEAPGEYRLTLTVTDGLAPAHEWLTTTEPVSVPLEAIGAPVRGE
jgi:peptidoglycan hydrolase-like protein with peptidoglycan-binding domain